MRACFFFGVKTTGVFCRPSCPARQPRRENVRFFSTASEALSAGFRACKRCRPLEVFGEAPSWLEGLLDQVEEEPHRRWTDQDLRNLKIEPTRVRRWFKTHHAMTFHAYLRARRLGNALGQISSGQVNATHAALESGYESISGFREAFKNWFGQPPTGSGEIQSIQLNRILTPLGPMVIAVTDRYVCLLEFADRPMLETQLKRIQKIYSAVFSPGDHALIQQTQTQLNEYFCGERTEFSVPIDTTGSTFQMQVWKELQKISYGRTSCYERIARVLGKPNGQRAVGRANGDNRLAIIVPCHRVIRRDGSISGYGGGVWRKKWLLDLESRQGLL